MPRTKGSKNKKVKPITNKNTNINNVHVHVEKAKTRKRRTTKPKPEPNNNPLSNTIGLSRPSSQNLGFHPRGLINNEPQQPTLIQTITAPPDPRLDKLEKRTKKIKEYLKNKGDVKENPINVNSPTFQDVFQTPSKQKPINLTFDNVTESEKKPNFIRRLFSASKKKEQVKQENEGFPLLEYKPEKPPATAPIFSHGESIETQTTPLPTGKAIEAELKLLVTQLHASHPNSKLAMGTFRSAIAKRLKDLGVASSHTTTYVKKMREFYDELYSFSNDIQPAGGVM